MPKSKSVQKAARAADKRRLRNRAVRSVTKTQVTQAEKAIASNEPEPAQVAVVAAVSALDRAAKKGVIHRNTAARRKSRLMRKFNQATLSDISEPEAKDADAVEE